MDHDPAAADRSSLQDPARPASADEPADAPLYVQIARGLKAQIRGGEVPIGSRLPTEEQLRRQFGVSRQTVRAALRILRQEGLIFSRKRGGTVVASPPSDEPHVLHGESIEDLISYAAGTRFVLRSLAMEMLEDEQARRVGVEAGQAWLAVRGLGRMKGEAFPFCSTEYFIHPRFAGVAQLLPRHKGPVFPLIEDLFGQSIVSIRQEITGSVISAAAAADLHVEAGSPGIQIRRAYRTADGTTAQVTIDIHPASRFYHATTMARMRDWPPAPLGGSRR